MESPTDKKAVPTIIPFQQPKTLFTRIYEEHQAVLLLKNYSEKMIDSFSQHGLYGKQLLTAFREVYSTNPEVYQVKRFSLGMSGFFTSKNRDGSRTKDKMHFQFAYSYDPAKIQLRLTALKATLNDQYEKVYPIELHPNLGLPAAKKVYDDLAAIRRTALSEVQVPRKPKTGKSLRKQI